MIQTSDDWFPVNHEDHINTVIRFDLSGIGRCALQTLPYQDDTNPPTIYITTDWGIVCGIRLDKPLFWGREYNFTAEQKKELNDFMGSIHDDKYYAPGLTVWHRAKDMWKTYTDRLERIKLPEEHPDYTKLP